MKNQEFEILLKGIILALAVEFSAAQFNEPLQMPSTNESVMLLNFAPMRDENSSMFLIDSSNNQVPLSFRSNFLVAGNARLPTESTPDVNSPIQFFMNTTNFARPNNSNMIVTLPFPQTGNDVLPMQPLPQISNEVVPIQPLPQITTRQSLQRIINARVPAQSLLQIINSIVRAQLPLTNSDLQPSQPFSQIIHAVRPEQPLSQRTNTRIPAPHQRNIDSTIPVQPLRQTITNQTPNSLDEEQMENDSSSAGQLSTLDNDQVNLTDTNNQISLQIFNRIRNNLRQLPSTMEDLFEKLNDILLPNTQISQINFPPDAQLLATDSRENFELPFPPTTRQQIQSRGNTNLLRNSGENIFDDEFESTDSLNNLQNRLESPDSISLGSLNGNLPFFQNSTPAFFTLFRFAPNGELQAFQENNVDLTPAQPPLLFLGVNGSPNLAEEFEDETPLILSKFTTTRQSTIPVHITREGNGIRISEVDDDQREKEILEIFPGTRLNPRQIGQQKLGSAIANILAMIQSRGIEPFSGIFDRLDHSEINDDDVPESLNTNNNLSFLSLSEDDNSPLNLLSFDSNNVPPISLNDDTNSSPLLPSFDDNNASPLSPSSDDNDAPPLLSGPPDVAQVEITKATSNNGNQSALNTDMQMTEEMLQRINRATGIQKEKAVGNLEATNPPHSLRKIIQKAPLVSSFKYK